MALLGLCSSRWVAGAMQPDRYSRPLSSMMRLIGTQILPEGKHLKHYSHSKINSLG